MAEATGDPSNLQQITVRGETVSINTAGDVISYLRSIEDGQVRGDAQAEVLDLMLRYHHRSGDMVEEVFNYVKADGAFRLTTSEGEFIEKWREVQVVISENAARRNRIGEAKKAMLLNWDPELVEWIGSLKVANRFMGCMRTLSKSCAWELAAIRINVALVSRLGNRGKGISSKRTVETNDLERALKSAATENPTRDELAKFGLRVGKYGLVEEGEMEALEGASDFPSPAQEMGSQAVTQTETQGGSATASASEPDRELEAAATQHRIDETIIEEVESELRNDETFTPADCGSDGERPAKRRKITCGCSPEVTGSWKQTVMRKTAFEEFVNLSLLGKMLGYKKVCYSHAKAVGAHVGLRIKMLNEATLKSRLQFIHNNRLQLGKIKTDSEKYSWFRKSNRPPRPSDNLGPYKFQHSVGSPECDFDRERVLGWICGGVNVEEWGRDGTVALDIFTWWWDTPIGKIMDDEFRMYRHHLRLINGKSNYGWLRNMFFSVGQQLMRQDPLYYTAYAALRPDKQWKLVSYPYYAKYSVTGDSTYFRHIDLNVPQMVNQKRGVNMIQGFVSMLDEDDTNCTIMLTGMHKCLGEWWDRVVKRGQGTDGYVHRVTEAMFTREDAAILGVDWKHVPGKRGQARIFVPLLPHGADGPAVRERRILLPWLVGVQDDLTSLEVVEGGSWEMLAAAHRDMTSPAATPSGLANRYGAIPYKFPAAVEVTGLGALSDALVCRRRWDSPQVLRDRDIMLLGSREEADKYLKKWRDTAVEVAVEAFKLVVEEEKRVFGDKSYWYNLERLERDGVPFPDLANDEGFDTDEGETPSRGEDNFAEKGDADAGSAA
ncbi:unnamed protein product [Sphagnum balticum]